MRRDSGRGRQERGRPEQVGGLVRSVLDRLGLAEKVERAGAVADWHEIVGPQIAEVTGEVRLSGRTLIVEVQSAAWLSELDMMRHELLRRLNRDRERGRIEKIVFVQEGGRRPGRR